MDRLKDVLAAVAVASYRSDITSAPIGFTPISFPLPIASAAAVRTFDSFTEANTAIEEIAISAARGLGSISIESVAVDGWYACRLWVVRNGMIAQPPHQKLAASQMIVQQLGRPL